jgi:hypothetical protein
MQFLQGHRLTRALRSLASENTSLKLKPFPAEVNRGIPKGRLGRESMRIDSPGGVGHARNVSQ